MFVFLYCCPITRQKMIIKSYRTFLLLILTFAGLQSLAQGEEQAIRQVVNTLFEGMRRSDTALIRTAFARNSMLQTIARNGSVMSEPLDSFLAAVSRPHTELYDERISFETIRIDGSLAMAWTPYKFYIGEKLNHCGVNSFQLVKYPEGWKIQYLIDTRRRQNCE